MIVCLRLTPTALLLQVACLSATTSSFVFATLMFAAFYDAAAGAEVAGLPAEEEGGGSRRECFGSGCVVGVGLTCAACCAATALLSVVLIRRSRRRADRK